MYEENVIYEYTQLLNDYTVKLFYGGLDYNDYRDIFHILIQLQKINTLYSNGDLKSIYDRFRKIQNELEYIYKYDSIIELLFGETSLLHLVFTNNEFNKIKLYSKDSFMFLCQFHHEKTPSLGVTNSKNLFYCFGCGQNGTVADYIMNYENLTYEEAVGLLARIYLIDLDYNVIDEENELVDKYRSNLLSEDFRKLLASGYERSLINGGVGLEEYNKLFNIIERVKNGKHIKYLIDKKDKPKSLVYNLQDLFKN